jgi:SPP1 family predicted phage head-tail adaptor
MRLPNTPNNVRFTSASEYDSRITLMRTAAGTDSDGNPNTPSVFARNVCAKIQEVRTAGRLDPTQQLAQQVLYYDVTIRYRSDVTNDMSLLGPNGQTWAITSIYDVAQAHVELRITVRETNGGEA